MFSRKSRWVQSLQHKFRERRFRTVLTIIEGQLAEKDSISILDAGGVVAYWRMLPVELRQRVHITILNLEESVEGDRHIERDGLTVELVAGDACNMPQYADDSFDMVHSNSVIEHVGSYSNMFRFASEVRRVGQVYYVQTPNFWFPIDPHNGVPFLHWFPDAMRAYLNSKMRLAMYQRTEYGTALIGRIEHCRMISARMLREFFPKADMKRERFLLLFTKSLIVTGR